MRLRLVALALVLVAASAAGAAQDVVYLHKANVDDTTTRHTFDPAKLKVVEKTVADGKSPAGEVKFFLIVTDYGLILGEVSTKAEAEVALTAAKKFTRMVTVGRRPRTFTYFER